jgi:hypothetical protein
VYSLAVSLGSNGSFFGFLFGFLGRGGAIDAEDSALADVLHDRLAILQYGHLGEEVLVLAGRALG